jgi:hypothetical protein
MKKLLVFCLTLFFISCSSDSTEPEPEIDQQTDDEVVVEEEHEENQTEPFSFSVLIKGNYLNENFNGTLFLSNENGEIILKRELLNNFNNNISIEIASNKLYDISILLERNTQFNTESEIHTFTNVSSGEYVIDSMEKNGNGDTFNLFLSNTGFEGGSPRLEIVNFSSSGGRHSSSNGGTYEADIELENYPSNFYGVYIGSTETLPRYFHKNLIERNNNFEIDFQTMPFVENKINYIFPPEPSSGQAEIYGFYEGNGSRKKELVYYPTGTTPFELYYPDNIFDNFLTYGFFRKLTDGIDYEFHFYGKPINQEYSFPLFEAEKVDASLENFLFESLSIHHFNVARFSKNGATINDDDYKFYIYGVGDTERSFSKRNLLEQILSESEVIVDEIEFRDFKLVNNSFLEGDYPEFIQSIIGNRQEYPSGTNIVSAEFR